MNNTRLAIGFLIAFTLGVLFSPILIGIAGAYSEQMGSWSATEKRQVINLLEKIEKNTR